MNRSKILSTAESLTTGDRNRTYGSPHQNMTDFAELVTTYIRTKYKGISPEYLKLTPEDGCRIMQLAKWARTFNPGFHADNYIDDCAYGAMAGECRAIDEEE